MPSYQQFDVEGIKFTIDTDAATASVKQLITEIERLNNRLETEKEFMRDGIQTQAQYVVAADKLKDSLRDKAEVLKDVAGVEAAGTGFAGLTGNVLKAEKVINSLVTDSGLGRIGGMLESISKGLGMTSGVGFAIGGLVYAVQSVLPHLETFFGYMDPEKIKASMESMKELAEQAKKMREMKAPEEVEKAADVTKLVAAQGGVAVSQGITSELRAAGWGLSDKDKKMMAQIAGMRARGEWVEPALVGEEARIGSRQEAAVTAEANRLLAQLPISKEARQTVAGMAMRRPGAFGAPRFGEALAFYDDEAAQQESKRADEELEQKDAERQGRKTARFEAAKVKNQREKDWQHGLNVQDTVFRQMDKEEADEKKRGNIAEANELLKRQNEEKHQADEARRKAEKAAHAALPEVQNRRRAEEQRNAMMGHMQQMDIAGQQMGGRPASPAFLEHATTAALQNLDAGFTIAAAVQNGIARANAKFMADFQRGMGQQGEMNAAMWQRQNGNQMFNPTQSNRGDGG